MEVQLRLQAHQADVLRFAPVVWSGSVAAWLALLHQADQSGLSIFFEKVAAVAADVAAGGTLATELRIQMRICSDRQNCLPYFSLDFQSW